jgi:hypothetical protein
MKECKSAAHLGMLQLIVGYIAKQLPETLSRVGK